MSEQRTLTIGQHLEELRGHVLRGLLVAALIAGGALLFQDQLMAIVLAPHQAVAREVAAQLAAEARADLGRLERLAIDVEHLSTLLKEVQAQPLAARPAEERQEIARRYARITERLRRAAPPAPRPELRFLSYQEAFVAHLKLALLAGLVLGLPYLLWELWRFVAEGLMPEERRWVKVFAPLSVVFLVLGVLFNYYVLTPISLRYLITYGRADLFAPAITVDGYVGFFFGLCLAMALVFELPLALVLLRIVGIVNVQRLRAFRRYFVLVGAVGAAIITPPDPWTMLLALGPLLALYEVGILAVWFFERASKDDASEDDASEDNASEVDASEE